MTSKDSDKLIDQIRDARQRTMALIDGLSPEQMMGPKLATVNPLLQNLHDDPRWEQFRMKVGIPTELIESLQFSIDVPN